MAESISQADTSGVATKGNSSTVRLHSPEKEPRKRPLSDTHAILQAHDVGQQQKGQDKAKRATTKKESVNRHGKDKAKRAKKGKGASRSGSTNTTHAYTSLESIIRGIAKKSSSDYPVIAPRVIDAQAAARARSQEERDSAKSGGGKPASVKSATVMMSRF